MDDRLRSIWTTSFAAVGMRPSQYNDVKAHAAIVAQGHEAILRSRALLDRLSHGVGREARQEAGRELSFGHVLRPWPATNRINRLFVTAELEGAAGDIVTCHVEIESAREGWRGRTTCGHGAWRDASLSLSDAIIEAVVAESEREREITTSIETLRRALDARRRGCQGRERKIATGLMKLRQAHRASAGKPDAPDAAD